MEKRQVQKILVQSRLKSWMSNQSRPKLNKRQNLKMRVKNGMETGQETGEVMRVKNEQETGQKTGQVIGEVIGQEAEEVIGEVEAKLGTLVMDSSCARLTRVRAKILSLRYRSLWLRLSLSF